MPSFWVPKTITKEIFLFCLFAYFQKFNKVYHPFVGNIEIILDPLIKPDTK